MFHACTINVKLYTRYIPDENKQNKKTFYGESIIQFNSHSHLCHKKWGTINFLFID